MTQVDQFLDDLDRLAGVLPTHDPDAFYRQLLPAAAAALGAEAADYDGLASQDTPPTSVRWPFKRPDAEALLSRERRHRIEIDQAPRILTAEQSGEPVVACPVEGAATVAGVLAFRLTPEAANNVERSLELTSGVAEIASRYELRIAADRVAGAQQRLARVEETLLQLHSQGTSDGVAQEAAESGRRLLDCDRLSVLIRRGSAWRVAAVSGVAQVSRRSDAAQQMTQLVRAAMRDALPVAVPGPNESLTPDLQDAVDAYREAAGVRALRVRPCNHLDDVDRFDAALLAEWFDSDCGTDVDSLLAALARHVGAAMARDPRGGWIRRSVPRAAAIFGGLGLLAAVVAAALLIPATLWVTAEGRFEPADRARLFAPLDAVVAEVLVEQAESVTAGQPVIRLDSPDLRLQQEEVAEAIAATEAELAALETAKLRASLLGRGDDADATTLASRVAALKEKLKHQEARRGLLDEQEASLVVTSPIGGAVLSWRPQDLLADRPVRRGQRLLEVAGGERWRIELEAPDHRSGHLLNANREGKPLAVEYVVRSAPEMTHLGTVEFVAEATHAGAEGVPFVRVVVDPATPSAANPRTGLGVSAKIDCGEHSLGYVWLHEAIAAVQRWWF